MVTLIKSKKWLLLLLGLYVIANIGIYLPQLQEQVMRNIQFMEDTGTHIYLLGVTTIAIYALIRLGLHAFFYEVLLILWTSNEDISIGKSMILLLFIQVPISIINILVCYLLKVYVNFNDIRIVRMSIALLSVCIYILCSIELKFIEQNRVTIIAFILIIVSLFISYFV